MATYQPVPATFQGVVDPGTFRRLAGDDGRLSAKEIRRGRLPIPPPPKGYQYSYQSKEFPNAPLTLKKDKFSTGKALGKAGLIAGGVAATALTGGAASPLLAAAIGAGTGAGVGAIDGGWKGAGLGALAGGATGGLLSGAGGAAGSAAKQGAGQAVKSALANPQTLASIGGQVVPGKAGTALSLLGGAGGGNMAGAGGWGEVVKGLLKDPNTYATAGSLLAGAAGGSADERARQNQAGVSENVLRTNTYGTQQSALNQLLQMMERGQLDRAELGLRAPSVRAGQAVRGSLMANIQPVSISHPRATIPKISGGLTPAALSQITRQAGRDLEGQAAEAIRTKSDIPAMTEFQSQLMDAPELTPYKDAGTGESLASGAGLIGSIIAALTKQGQGSGMARTTPPITAPPPSGSVNPLGVGANRDPYAGLFGG